jgi:hypothetical protein
MSRPGPAFPNNPIGPWPIGLKAIPPSTAPYHSSTSTPKRFSNDCQIASGIPALVTILTGLSASSGLGGSL